MYVRVYNVSLIIHLLQFTIYLLQFTIYYIHYRKSKVQNTHICNINSGFNVIFIIFIFDQHDYVLFNFNRYFSPNE